MIVEQNVVADRVVRAARLNVERPARVAGFDQSYYSRLCCHWSRRRIDPIERNAGGVIVIEQVVLDARVLHAVMLMPLPPPVPLS